MRTSFALNYIGDKTMVDKTKRSGSSTLLDVADVKVYTDGDSKVAFFEKDIEEGEDRAFLSCEKAYHTRDWR